MIDVLPCVGAEKDSYAAPSSLFLEKIGAITSIKIIFQLTKAVQQHRGSTMAVLSGDISFFELTREQGALIDKLLDTYLQLNQPVEQQEIPVEVSHALSSWLVIKEGWQSDELIPNFEFHNHMIQSLKKVTRRHLHDELMSGDSITKDYGALLDIVLLSLPNLIEAMAMLRGLSTNAAVVQRCDKDSHSRLSFLVKDIQRQLLEINTGLEGLLSVYPDLHELKLSSGVQRGLKALLRRVSLNILQSQKIQEDGAQLFKTTTAIIDTFDVPVERGIHLIERRIYQDYIGSP